MLLIDPETHLNAIQSMFINDASLLEHLGLSLTTPITQRAKQIIKRSQYQDLANNLSRICIYFRPSRVTFNQNITEQVLEIDVHVPITSDFKAYRAQKRIVELLHNKEMNGLIWRFEASLGELATATGYFCVGSRFVSYTTK